jgi:hypothetical protein
VNFLGSWVGLAARDDKERPFLEDAQELLHVLVPEMHVQDGKHQGYEQWDA